ncbi:hypothetical protein JCM10599A_64940 [Paraburkholderia kururiensis]
MMGTATAYKTGSHQWRQIAATAMAPQLVRRRCTNGGVGECDGGAGRSVVVRLQYTIGVGIG